MLKSTGGRPVLALVSTLALAGCADIKPSPLGPPPPPPPPPPAPPAPAPGVVIVTPFRADDFAWSTVPGKARIRGLTAPNRSCAGNAVALTPDTAYSRERIAKLYGSTDYAIVPTSVVRAKVIANDNPAMRGYVRSARCDSSGAFAFDDLPAGPFFIIAEIGEPSGPKVVMRRVTTVTGRVIQVPLTASGPPLRRRRMG